MDNRQQDLEEALEYRYGRARQDTLLTFHWLDAQGRFQTEVVPNTRDQRKRMAEKYAGATYDVWSRMTTVLGDRSPRGSGRGLRQDTAQACVLWVDLDPKLRTDESIAQWRERTLAELEAFDPPPSRIESSGRGFYPMWAIEPTEDWQWVEEANKWLALRLNGDSGYDAAKILRLPGTLNPKKDVNEWATTVRTGSTTYGRQDFKQASLSQDEQELRAITIQPTDLPSFFGDELANRYPKLWARIESEESARAVGAQLKDTKGRVDRSHNDYYIACQLLRLRRTQGEVYSVLTHPLWFSGDKFRTSGYKEAYVLTTIQSASTIVDASWKNAAQSAERIMEMDEYWLYLGDWYVYNSSTGMFEPNALQKIRRAVYAIAGDDWSIDKSNAVVKRIAEEKERDDRVLTELINVRNGMLDPMTGELMDHSAAFDCLYQLDAVWKPERVYTDHVDAFVGEILQPDEIEIWWQFCGYCLYTNLPMTSRILLFIIGPAQSGKSELLYAQRYFLGKQNVTSLQLGDLTGEGNSFTTSGLVNSLLNIDDDVDPNTTIRRTGTLKKLATGSPLSIEKKGRTPVSMELVVKMAFAANAYPSFGMSLDDALQTRLRVLGVRNHPPFNRDNPDRRVNAHLELLSVAENRDAWLYRCVEGYRQLAELNWEFPETVTTSARKQELEQREDSIVAFLTQFDFEGQEIPMRALTGKYQMYCALNGERAETWRRFSDRLKETADRLGLGVHEGNLVTVWRKGQHQ
jgi:P4 family phage/plasmid primase-like protien